MSTLPEKPSVSVILCTHELELYRYCREAIDSVLSQTYGSVELVIMVDGSPELYQKLVQDYSACKDVVIQMNDKNVGLLRSRNRGVELASGDIVAFIDDDAVAEENWIEELVSTYQEEDAISAGGKMIADWMNGQPVYLPDEFFWLVGVTHRGFPEDPAEIRNTFGSNLSFRREVFLDLGGFNPAIGGRQGDTNLQGGETELCVRLWEEYGRGVYYNPDARVTHKVFDYRKRITWLLNRAFWQGYSKRAMEVLVAGRVDEESEFLKRLVTEFLPGRIRAFLRRPSREQALQLATLVALSGTVGFGYLYGALRYGR